MLEEIEKDLAKLVIFLLKYLNIYNQYIKNKYFKTESKYQFLTPNDNAEHIEEYSIALEDALNEKKVRNIAISGSYGSGKSSFIKTFERHNENGVYKFLDISLAKFNKKNEANPTKTDDMDPSLIEKSILEQMFYKVKSKQIPQSRLNKINRMSYLPLRVVSSILAILSFFIVFKPEILSEVVFFKDIIEITSKDYIKYIPIIILLVGAYFFTRKILLILSNTSMDKVNLKDLELVSNDKKNESLLNRHLDEILYFFEKTSFNIVVFQDLDRFGNLDIFTKLRELNNFINNSEQINRDIKFIYAVKDEMFCDAQERTKFFDFVIPIIPYINATNSKEKLLEFFKEEVKHNFLYDISLYVSDMRLLKNIYNEYKIYSINLNSKLDKTELLAMIIYKNFEPQDFEKLHKYEGLVFDIFKKKSEHIKTVIAKLNIQIEVIKQKSEEIDNEFQENVIELRKIYLLKIVENFNTQFRGSISTPTKNLNLKISLEDENFELIRNCKEIGFDNYQYSTKLDFKNIENEINSKYSYKQREQFILDKINNKKDELLSQINKLKDEINEIENYSIKKIINTYKDINIFDEKFEKKELLKYLISYGHINKDYDIYMSNFFGISISKNDHDFLLNIKNNGTHFDFNYTLNNLNEILKIERLEVEELKKEAILNFKLITYIIDNKSLYPKQYIQIFKQLSNESEVSKEFIFDYLDTYENLNSFIKSIVKYYPSIWQHIVTSNDFTVKQQEKYFYSFLDNLEFDDILKLNVDNTLKNYIKLKTEFEHIPNNSFNYKLIAIIEKLNIKFKLFKEHREKITPFRFIYENNFYELNQQMIDYIVYVESGYDSDIYDYLMKSHYTTIFNSKAEKLKQYITDNINEYIENVNLKIDTNDQEIGKIIIDFLNNKKIKEEIKVKIIQKQKNKIVDINSINSKEIWSLLFEYNFLLPTWNNILYYYIYRENNLDLTLINYLNIQENYTILSVSKINNEKDFDKDTILQSFNRELMLCDKISNDAYDYLIKSIHFINYPKLNIENLHSKKIELMLEFNKFKFYQENIDSLKKYFSPKHIVFLEKNIKKFIENYSSFSIDSDDVEKLLESKNITDKNKKEIIELIDYNLIRTPKIAKLIYSNVDKSIIKPYIYVKNMISQLESIESKVNLLVEQESELDNDKLTEMLELMSDEYSKIAKLDGKQTVLSAKDYNKKFIKLLHSRKFITLDKLEKKDEIRLFIKNKS
ncbi:MAG: hypothetical protein PHY66_08295 [Aliarcobacter sp.]|nr:hypothetical protein [Aliarcobacter sp.]MDD2887790.1 hypothetical protein [Aliarcobacter sp.]